MVNLGHRAATHHPDLGPLHGETLRAAKSFQHFVVPDVAHNVVLVGKGDAHLARTGRHALVGDLELRAPLENEKIPWPRSCGNRH